MCYLCKWRSVAPLLEPVQTCVTGGRDRNLQAVIVIRGWSGHLDRDDVTANPTVIGGRFGGRHRERDRRAIDAG